MSAVAADSESLCRHNHFAQPAADRSDYRKYAPSREVDILHLALNVQPNFTNRTVAGTSKLLFKPLGKALHELKLDAIDLTIIDVKGSEAIESYQVAKEQIIITFAKPIPVGKEASVEVSYQAEPARGLFFRTTEMGYKDGETHLWTQGEAMDHRHWYPGYDFPNEKFTSEVTCTVPVGMTVLSNGKLISQNTNSAKDSLTVTWKQEKPHVNYLVALVAGYFDKIEDQYKDIPMAFYVPPSDIKEAANSYGNTKDMMAFFEKEIGVPYPWEKYYQVVVRDFTFGGMENTSLTILTDRTLFTKEFEALRRSDGLVAHELAHQWFGNLVTCKDWSHLWLNEGFATYYDVLYDGHKNGRDTLLYRMWQTANSITAVTNEPKSIVYRTYDKPMEQFSYLAYRKGSWILHMLRSQLGESLYRRCIQTYVERNQFDTVVTQDLNAVIEELSGRSYDRFFDQWVYHAHHPELEAEYSYDATTRLAKVSVKQTQKISDKVLLFEFPLEVQFTGKFGATNVQFTVKEKGEDFYVSLPSAPESVVLDPKVALLARTKFKLPNQMLYAQLNDKKQVGARLNAVEQLATKKDQQTVAKLKEVLNKDAFWGVRVEAAKALQSIHTDEALAALIDSQTQKDARARKQVLESIGGFFSDSTLRTATAALGGEKNPDIIAQAVRNLGAYSTGEVEEILKQQLKSESYMNVTADAAVAAMRTQDNPIYIAPLLAVLKERENKFTTRGFVAGLDALAYLSRNETEKAVVREFLVGLVKHPKEGVKLGAISSLGTLEDTQAVAVLETFATAARESPERTAADKAIAQIRSAKRPSDNLATLRSTLLELKKESSETRKELDTLKKQLQATDPKSGAVKKKK
ncbi:MAG: HEAT repeat domain-containing protein [Verrucomicrobia bacterium]|nr:HEAT repeat domain-containing protein [Verrucomicrobiota bacterium]